MRGAVHVVFSEWVSGGLRVYAICTSRKAAEMARNRIAKGKRSLPGNRIRYYDLPPDSSPYACQVRITKVRVDVLYPESLEEKKLTEFYNNNEQEVIA